MKPKMREQILTRHNKLVDTGSTGWTTEQRDRGRLLEYVTQLEEVPCTHCFNRIANLEADIEKCQLLIIDCPECYQTLRSMHAKLTKKDVPPTKEHLYD